MFTVLDALSIAGDRAKQNDDALGWSARRAWVIDGATDLHETPVARSASDAAWIAQRLDAALAAGSDDADVGALFQEAATRVALEWRALAPPDAPRWMMPTAAVLHIGETEAGIDLADLGDCRMFGLDASGQAFEAGGNATYAKADGEGAAKLGVTLDRAVTAQRAEAMAHLRATRDRQNQPNGYAVFGVEPHCAAALRRRSIRFSRPAHLVLATDGFSALVDAYAAYDPAGLVRAALTRGLAALIQDLRAIEAADDTGAKHPRWKRSDDATAVLVRLT